MTGDEVDELTAEDIAVFRRRVTKIKLDDELDFKVVTKKKPITLRKYQKECVKACDELPVGERGQIILPTGSGKTVIGQEVIKNQAGSNGATTTVIFVPRLMLAKQWIKTTSEELLRNAGLKIAFINVNSGGVSNKVRRAIETAQFEMAGVSRKLLSNINPEQITNEVKWLRKEGYHTIVICTYHSSAVLRETKIAFDLGLYDECHFLVSSSEQETEYRNALKASINKRLFFTATPRSSDSDDGLGMNNETEFGKVIFERKPKHMIEAGAIVGPRLHIVGCDTVLDGGDWNNRMDMVFQAFQFHEAQLKNVSAHPDEIGAKLLVVVDGQLALEGLFESRRFGEIRKEYPHVRMYGLSTDFGLYLDDGRGGADHREPPVNNSHKEDFLYELDALKSSDSAIIFHVDMLAEGLDVPGITGLLPLRQCSKIKFLQNLGRSTRLHKVDRERIENKALKIGNMGKYIKPHCYVVIPYVLENREDFLERYAVLIEALRTEYGFDPSDNVEIDIIHPEQEGPEWDEDKLDREIRSRVIGDIQEYYSLQEEQALNVDEILTRHKVRRFTPDQMTKFIRIVGGYLRQQQQKP